ncbi:MAG: hypothetical protein ACP5PV_11990 [Methanothrix sp.]
MRLSPQAGRRRLAGSVPPGSPRGRAGILEGSPFRRIGDGWQAGEGLGGGNYE